MNLVGRTAEVILVQRAIATEPQSSRALMFLGDPGVGKSALLDYATQAARECSERVVTVHGVEQESDFAYFGLHQALTPLLDYASELSPHQAATLRTALGEVGDSLPPDRLTLFSTVFALFSAASRSRPLLLCVDDVQWLDPVSREALFFVARRVEGSNMRFIAAARTSPERVSDAAGILVHQVEPLTAESADLLLRQRFPSLPVRTRTRLLEEAEGNPLALLELPVLLTDRRQLDHASVSSPLPLTRRLQETFSERIRSLPPATRELLLTAAMEGTGDLNVLRRALEDPALTGLAPAEDAGVVRVTAGGDRLAFRHPLTRSAVAEDATAAEKRAAHKRLAVALDFDLDRKAHHLAEAALEPNEEVAGILYAAAKRAAQRGVEGEDAAVGLLIRSADLSPNSVDRRRRMAEAAFMGAFHGATAGDSTSMLHGISNPSAGSDEALWAASASAFRGTLRMSDLNGLFRLVDSALEAASATNNVASDAFATTVQTFSYLCTLADSSEQTLRLDHWMTLIPPGLQSRGVNLLRAHIDPARYGLELLAQVDEAMEQAADSPDPLVVGQAVAAGAFLDRLSGGRPALERIADAEVDWERGGDIPIRTLLTTEAFHAGRWDETLRFARDGLLISENRDTPLFIAYFQHREALIAAVTGDSRRAVSIADPLLSTFARQGYGRYKNEVSYALLLDAMGRGDYESAFAIASSISAPGELARGVPLALWVFYDLIASAVLTDRVSEARRHLSEVKRLNISAISAHYSLMVAASEALLLDGAQKAAAFLAPRLERPGSEAFPLDLARVRLLQARFLISSGRPVEARALIGQAVEALEALGAQPWLSIAARLEAESTSTGDAINTLGLTVTEMRIVRLAASGLTNKQIGSRLFISDRTVGTHLYRAFPKLGVTRRASLRDAVAHIDAQNSSIPRGVRRSI